MRKRTSRNVVTSRVVRPGDAVPADDDWLSRTVEERIAGVWELTELCYAWNREGSGEPRLQRTVARVQRAWR